MFETGSTAENQPVQTVSLHVMRFFLTSTSRLRHPTLETCLSFDFTVVLHAPAAKLCRVLVGSGNIGYTAV